MYGHHFASIAGAGPIVGPAIAMAWGWLPTLLWVNRLMQLRLAILDNRKIIVKVTGEPIRVKIGNEMITLPYDPREDPVFRELESYRNDVEWINNIFTSNKY